MTRAQEKDAIRMYTYQAFMEETPAESEEELHLCGNTACFVGYLALSPEWRESTIDGFRLGTDDLGVPTSFYAGAVACIEPNVLLADWLGIPITLASMLIFKSDVIFSDPSRLILSAEPETDDAENLRPHAIYGVNWPDVRAEHVIKALTTIRDHGVAEAINIFVQQWDGTEYKMEPYFAREVSIQMAEIEHPSITE